jgi:hypothetical protein
MKFVISNIFLASHRSHKKTQENHTHEKNRPFVNRQKFPLQCGLHNYYFKSRKNSRISSENIGKLWKKRRLLFEENCGEFGCVVFPEFAIFCKWQKSRREKMLFAFFAGVA